MQNTSILESKPTCTFCEKLKEVFRTSKTNIQEFWNQELEFPVLPNQQIQVLKNIKFRSCDLKLKLIFQKIVFHIYRIPSRKFWKGWVDNYLCWHWKKIEGTSTHIVSVPAMLTELSGKLVFKDMCIVLNIYQLLGTYHDLNKCIFIP